MWWNLQKHSAIADLKKQMLATRHDLADWFDFERTKMSQTWLRDEAKLFWRVSKHLLDVAAEDISI